nr:hypothetical protein [Tanacetum cinerariifolium]
MTKASQEHAMVSYIKKQRRTNHKDYHNCLFACFLSQIEPKKVTQALTDLTWIEAMQDELLQFRLQKDWRLVDLPKGKHAIGTKWMDVKSVFLYGTIEEEVYVFQPPGFKDLYFPDKVYKVEKELYCLHQAPRAWYETLSTYLLENRFRRGIINKTLFIKKDKEFKELMHKKFQMSSMGELTFFLGFQVMQRDDGIFICQDKYMSKILKKFDFYLVKTASTSIKTNKALLKDEEAENVCWNRPAFYNNDEDDDEEYTIAITPVLPTEKPDNSLIMGDEHPDTIPVTESDEVIKSSVEDLISIPSESEGIPKNMCDVPFHDDPPPLDILKDQFEIVSDSNDDSTSIDDDSFSIDDIDYEDGELEDDVLREKLSNINLLIAKIEALNANPTQSSDFVLKFPISVEDEKNSGSTTIYADISLLDLECFYFKSEPDTGDSTSIIDLGIHENVSSTTNVILPFEDDQSPLFAYVVWIFLSFLTYPVASPYLLSSRNEDTILTPTSPFIILLCRVYLIEVELS